MAATIKWSERRGASQELTTAGKIVWRASQTFQVTEAANEADAVAQIPYQLGSDHDVYGSALKVNFIDPQQKGPAGFWEVRVDFSSDRPELNGTPLNTKPKYRWTRAVVTEEVDRDFDGNPIMNSAGDPPGNHPTVEIYDLVLGWTQYEPFFNLRGSMEYVGAVNSDNFTLLTREIQALVFGGECQCTAWEPVGDIELGQSLVQVYREFRFRQRIKIKDDAWASAFDFRFMDQGNRGWYVDSTDNDVIRGEFWEPSLKAAIDLTRLDGHGAPITEGMTVEGKTPLSNDPPPGAELDERFLDNNPGAVFLIYKRHARLNFKNLIPLFR